MCPTCWGLGTKSISQLQFLPPVKVDANRAEAFVSIPVSLVKLNYREKASRRDLKHDRR